MITFSDFSNPWNFFQVFLNEEAVAHDWCRKNGLLALSLPCETCDGQATLRKRAGYVANESFRCNKNSCHERQTREYSFFERAKLSVNDIMLFVKCYLDGNSLRQCATFAGISYGSTSVEWAVYIRDILKDYFRRYVINETLSGEVELDESLFGRKVKYHRGNPNLGTKIWIFGMVDRNTNSIILYPVNDRSQNTLIPLIERHIEKGSTIYSDGWSAYCDLNSRGYRHFTVLHKYAFKKIYVNVETKEEIVVHTNRIEGAWKHAKNHFRKMSGTLSSQFEGHLAEIIWRSRAKGRLYESFFEQMKTVYGLDGPPVFAFSRSQPVFDSWDGAPQNSQYKEMVMPVPTDVESEAESTPPMPSMLDSASSTSQRNEDAQFALEISSDDSYIPPNRPRSQLRAETVQSLSELFSGSSISSDSETAEQEKTLVEQPSPVVRPKGSARLIARAGRTERYTESSSSAASKQPTALKKCTRQKKTAPVVVQSAAAEAPTSTDQLQRLPKQPKRPSRKEHVCHPSGFAEKEDRPVRRRSKSKRKTATNPYSKGAFVWISSDDDFQ